MPDALKKLGAAAAAIGAIVTLGFTLFPEWRPAGPPAHMGASLGDMAVEHGVPYQDYLLRVGLSDSTLGPDDLERQGSVFQVHIEMVGFKDRACMLKYSVYDARTSTRVPGLGDIEVANFTPEAERDEVTYPVWVPSLDPTGYYFVRFQLYDDNGTPIAHGESEPWGG